ncbi:Peroxin-3 [Hortaea werneckii]|nr:Peroxin-3 [Hortaea werneckii]KAI7101166.1 Peroxin-3 [Hortaea werneckii]KAI7243495.1 Peroxin-3 [Hortaea werneckii]KAI7331084.1 Peroxin-3 [Hortaea werneckii]KAI7380621.1 Peroxin-3 [Hortaea werneckii]
MIAATRRWFRRNRTNLAIGAGVIGAGYLAGQYVLGKIQEARQRMTEERISKENLRRRFEQNQEDCTYTVLALLPTIREEILEILPVEQITEELQRERQERLKRIGASDAASSELPSVPPSVGDEDGKSISSSSYVHASQVAGNTADGEASPSRPKKSKAQLWQEMKINAITRALTLIYTLSLLTLLTRIQLNLLGRRTYLSSVVAMASPQPAQQSSTISLENKDDDNYENIYGNDFETNRKYLTFSWWLLHRGSKLILERVQAAVKEVFGLVNIREDMSLERLSELILEVRKKVEGATEQDRQQMRWLEYLLPPQDEEAFVVRQAGSPDGEGSEMDSAYGQQQISGPLRRLLDETSDLIDSPTFSQVLTRLLDAGYSNLVDNRIAVEAFKAADPSSSGVLGMSAYGGESRVSEVVDTKAKLAHILPVFCRQAHVIAAGSGDLEAVDGVTGGGNDYLTVLDGVDQLSAFAAVIYSSNFEQEVAEGAKESNATDAPRTATYQSTNTHGPNSMTQVPETQPTELAEGLLRSEVDNVSGSAAGANVSSGGEPSPSSDLEAAWKKALLAEDGK